MMKLLNFDLNKIINSARFAVNALEDFVFPKTCIICGETVAAGKNISLCEVCKTKVEKNGFGMLLKDFGECDYIVSAVKYVDTVRQKMIMYKFKNCKYLSHSFAYLAQCALEKSNVLNNYSDCVIMPMPVHITRDRLYNQSALIAYDTAKYNTVMTQCAKRRQLNRSVKCTKMKRKYSYKIRLKFAARIKLQAKR